ncbi:hypothetical protein [Nafulsella turpanensis]|uniref:hypothetical protein n=1 Tax=Nafulsella turpanensis TaxID=1265690 RepID=UPI000346B1C3|nr:hypothetical protein [Nafulsella turpanensis]
MAAEASRENIVLSANAETLAEGLLACIYENQLLSLSLGYERSDGPRAQQVVFNFWLSGKDKKGKLHILHYLQKIPHDWPSFIRQLEEVSAESGIPFQNQFKEDGYQVHCQSIRRTIWRQK